MTRVADPSALGLPDLALLFGVSYLMTGLGFLQGTNWSWDLGMILSFLNLVEKFVLFGFGDLLSGGGVVVALLIIFYLLSLRVKQFFGLEKSERL